MGAFLRPSCQRQGAALLSAVSLLVSVSTRRGGGAFLLTSPKGCRSRAEGSRRWHSSGTASASRRVSVQEYLSDLRKVLPLSTLSTDNGFRKGRGGRQQEEEKEHDGDFLNFHVAWPPSFQYAERVRYDEMAAEELNAAVRVWAEGAFNTGETKVLKMLEGFDLGHLACLMYPSASSERRTWFCKYTFHIGLLDEFLFEGGVGGEGQGGEEDSSFALAKQWYDVLLPEGHSDSDSGSEVVPTPATMQGLPLAHTWREVCEEAKAFATEEELRALRAQLLHSVEASAMERVVREEMRSSRGATQGGGRWCLTLEEYGLLRVSASNAWAFFDVPILAWMNNEDADSCDSSSSSSTRSDSNNSENNDNSSVLCHHSPAVMRYVFNLVLIVDVFNDCISAADEHDNEGALNIIKIMQQLVIQQQQQQEQQEQDSGSLAGTGGGGGGPDVGRLTKTVERGLHRLLQENEEELAQAVRSGLVQLDPFTLRTLCQSRQACLGMVHWHLVARRYRNALTLTGKRPDGYPALRVTMAEAEVEVEGA